MTSSSAIQDLEKVLMEEVQLYRKYAEFMQNDADLMVNLKVDELEASNKAKETIILKVHALEQARQQLVNKIAQEKAIQTEKVRLKDLCGHIDPAAAHRLLHLRTQLLDLAESLKTSQNATSSLARSSLTWIEGAMSTLKSLLSPSGTYDARGQVGSQKLFSGHVVESKA